MGKAPYLSHLRVFGSNFWYVVTNSKVEKLVPLSEVVIMVGYSAQSKGYKLWDPESLTFVVLRDVTFHESSDTTVDEIDVKYTSTRDSTVPAGPARNEEDGADTAGDDVDDPGGEQTASPLTFRPMMDKKSPLADHVERPDRLENSGRQKAVLITQAATRFQLASFPTHTRNPRLLIKTTSGSRA